MFISRIRPGGGRLQVAPSSSAEVIAQTLDGIAGASDPLQAFADACGMSFKMDYLWIGNELVGATELGGSGLDLTATSITQEQADARLGAGNTCLFNSTGDKMAGAHSDLNIGTGAVAMFNVHANNTLAGGYLLSKYTGTAGWRNLTGADGSRQFTITTTSGSFTANVTANHGTANAQVDLMRRLVSSNTVNLDTREGSASGAEATVATADNAVDFSLGANLSIGSLFNWGLTAFKKGPDAELVTATHRSNLQTWLGF